MQKTAYIKQQLELQRAAEEIRKYNQEFQEHVNMQIYKSHGITNDKMMGMREYKDALYRGGAAVIFLLSLILTVLILTVLCGALYGFQSDVCILQLFQKLFRCFCKYLILFPCKAHFCFPLR